MNRRIGRPNREPGPVSRETEEWVAAITGQTLPTPEAERELNEWVADITGQPVRSAQDEQELNEWLADISTRHEHLRGKEQCAQEWDSDLHPRLGGPPNAGWFAPKDGGVTGSTHGGYRSPDAQKVTSSGADLSRADNTTDRHGPDAHRARDQRDNLLQFQQPGQQRDPRVIQPGQVTQGG